MTEVALLVNGQRFTAWKSVSVTRAIDAMCDAFSFQAVDFAEAGAWPIYEEDACEVLIDGRRLITGKIDSRVIELSSKGRTLTYSGRSKACELVDCSALTDTWQLRGPDLVGFLRKLCEPHGVAIGTAAGVVPVRPEEFSVTPGDSVFELIDRACRFNSLLPRSLSDGSVAITKPGDWTTASRAIVQGQNLVEGTARYTTAERFAKYVVHGVDAEGRNKKYELADPGVSTLARVLYLQAEGAADLAALRRRAEWERSTRSGRSTSVEVTARDVVWQPGELVDIDAPALGAVGTMLAASVTYTVGEQSPRSRVVLVPPDAFAVEQKPVKSWKLPREPEWHAVSVEGEPSL